MEKTSVAYKIRRKGQKAASYILPDEWLCKAYSRVHLKRGVNLRNPRTFNEKIQWLKLNYFPYNQLVVRASDKYAVRGYVKEKGFGDILVPLLGTWTDAEDIEWENLPDKFMLKCNHGCAYNIMCADKNSFDRQAAKEQLNMWMKEDFGAYNIERHYSRIRPRRIICEEFLGGVITDYKFFCMNGKPEYLYVSNNLIDDRRAMMGIFNLDGSKLPVKREEYADIQSVEFPPFYEEMLNTAKELCKDFVFVRVDFFLANGKYYFAELTFTPSAGMMAFNPPWFDLAWGGKLDIREEMSKKAEERKTGSAKNSHYRPLRR